MRRTVKKQDKNVYKTSLIFAFSFMILFPPFINTFAQKVLVHKSFFYDDGDSLKDGDKKKNNIVIWKPDCIHVVSNYYTVDARGKLIIEPGTIVKLAGNFEIDTSGKVTKWSMPLGAELGVYPFYDTLSKEGCMQIDGATITSICDDESGGDTNQDGSATVPLNSGSYYLRFSSSTNNYLKNSKIKYASIVGCFGSMKITNNKFTYLESFGSFSPGLSMDTEPVHLEAVPVITNNLFELYGSSGNISLRGCSAVFEDNIVRYAPGAAQRSIPIIQIGPGTETHYEYDITYNRAGPNEGVTSVQNNDITADIGIEAITYPQQTSYAKIQALRAVPFKAVIRNNKITGTGRGLSYSSCGITAAFSLDIEVLNNSVSGFVYPFRIWVDSMYSKSPEIIINGNTFIPNGNQSATDSISYKYWSNNIFVDARNNYWGDPTGPKDLSSADGLYNPRGKGSVLGNGINYIPFIGGTEANIKDNIFISAETIPFSNVSLVPGLNTDFEIKIDKYNLLSSDKGIIEITIRDAFENIINYPPFSINILGKDTTCVIPAISITIPLQTNIVKIQARLFNTNMDLLAVSNTVVFNVEQPPSKIVIRSIDNLQNGILIPGNTYSPRFDLKYSLTTSAPSQNGSIEFDFKLRNPYKKITLYDYPLISFNATPGENIIVKKDVQLNIPLYDMLENSGAVITLNIYLKDDKGNIAGKLYREFSLTTYLNEVHGIIYGELTYSPTEKYLSSFYCVDEDGYPHFYAELRVNIAAQSAQNWKIITGPTIFTYYNGFTDTLRQEILLAENLSSGSTVKYSSFTINQKVNYSAISKIRQFIYLIEPSKNLVIHFFSREFKVTAPPDYSVKKEINTGASQNSFTPASAAINFTSNQKAISLLVNEYKKPISFSILHPAKNAMQFVSGGNYYWQLIPINKYWTIENNIKDGTYNAALSFTYSSADLPGNSGFLEDSLIIAGLNPYSGEFEVLSTTLDKTKKTITASYNHFFETWIAASKKTIITHSFPEAGKIFPTEYLIKQNYPNPFNPATKIEYSVAGSCHVKIDVYNMLGQKVYELVNQQHEPGNYIINFNASHLATGVYFYSFNTFNSANGTIKYEVKKMVVLR